MRNIFTIIRRELAAYFCSPIGYIYLIAFLLCTNLLSLYVIRGKSFFEFPVAEMREYFIVLAGVATFLLAAITMRLWSEERKENTFEMLLTFPMRSSELVLGKFCASLIFYLVALAGTLTVPVMMAWLSRGGGLAESRGFFGLLDPGATLSGYFGSLCVGAFFIAFGLFVSALCRDQIVAFVISAPVSFFAYILGTDKVKGDLDEALSFLGENIGARIGDFIGIYAHFENLIKGRVALSDILFFLIWVAIFLVLNAWAIERRCRPGGTLMFSLATLILCGIGFAGNWIFAGTAIAWMDATRDKTFTISDISVQILKRLKEPVNIRYIVTPRHKMPTYLQNLERDVRDKLEALRIQSGGMIRVQVIHREAQQDIAEDEDEGRKPEEKDSLEKRLLRKIKPFPVAISGMDEATTAIIYSGLEIAYREKESEIIPQVCPDEMAGGTGEGRLSQLEYAVIKYVDKLTREKAPVIAMVAPKQEVPPYMAQIYMQMGRPLPPPQDPYDIVQYYLERDNYEVRRVRLNAQDKLPDEYDALVVLGPRELNERQQYEIARALEGGKAVFLAIQNYTFECSIDEDRLSVRRQRLNPNLNFILTANGITVDDALVMTRQPSAIPVLVNTIIGQLPQAFRLPFDYEVGAAGMNIKHPILANVGRFRYQWGTPLRLDEDLLKKNNCKYTVILASEPNCWLRTLNREVLTKDDLKPASPPAKPVPLAVVVEGQFKNPFEKPPAWPKETQSPMDMPPPSADETPPPVKPSPGKLLVLGNAQAFVRGAIGWPEMNFFLNSVSYLSLDEAGQEIRKLRDKEMKFKLFDIKGSAIEFWKLLHVIGVYAVIAAVGIAVYIYRLRRREAYLTRFRNVGE